MPTWEEGDFGRTFYDDVLEWIVNNHNPGEVFTKGQLIEYSKENFDPTEIYDLEEYGYVIKE